MFLGRRRRPKIYKSDHTQTSQNSTILYYHERKKSSLEDTIPLLDEDDEASPDHLEEDDKISSRSVDSKHRTVRAGYNRK